MRLDAEARVGPLWDHLQISPLGGGGGGGAVQVGVPELGHRHLSVLVVLSVADPPPAALGPLGVRPQVSGPQGLRPSAPLPRPGLVGGGGGAVGFLRPWSDGVGGRVVVVVVVVVGALLRGSGETLPCVLTSGSGPPSGARSSGSPRGLLRPQGQAQAPGPGGAMGLPVPPAPAGVLRAPLPTSDLRGQHGLPAVQEPGRLHLWPPALRSAGGLGVLRATGGHRHGQVRGATGDVRPRSGDGAALGMVAGLVGVCGVLAGGLGLVAGGLVCGVLAGGLGLGGSGGPPVGLQGFRRGGRLGAPLTAPVAGQTLPNSDSSGGERGELRQRHVVHVHPRLGSGRSAEERAALVHLIIIICTKENNIYISAQSHAISCSCAQMLLIY